MDTGSSAFILICSAMVCLMTPALAANGLAVHALVTTHVSAAAAMFSWLAIDKHVTGHPSLVGGSTGLVAGLVAITPGAGFVSIWSVIRIRTGECGGDAI